ncbi:MAG: MFS transporter [Desulfobacca sp.]|uniref:MFS transporter n=1 Tax=Desulfobacca sp. TaxID=2067990 RepID=UPI004049D060
MAKPDVAVSEPAVAWLPSFFILVLSLLMSGVYFFLPLYLKHELQFSGWQIGVLYAAASLNALLVTFPLGVAGDRYSLVYLLRIGLILSGCCLWGLGHFQAFMPYLLAFWGFGLGLHAFRIALDTVLFKSVGQSSVRALAHYNSWRMAGMLLGTLAGGFLFQRLGFAVSLQLLAAVPLLLLWPTCKLPRLQLHHSPWWQYGRDFWQRPVLFFATWLFLFCLHWGAETTSYGLFLQENLRLSPQGMGLYMASEFAVLAVTAYFYGRFWYGRLAPLTFLGLALLTSGLGHIFMTIPIVAVSLGWRLVHGFGDALILMESYTTIARLFQVERMGGNSSLISLVSVSGSFAGALFFGPLGAAWGYQWPLILSGCISLGLLPLTFWGRRGRPG